MWRLDRAEETGKLPGRWLQWDSRWRGGKWRNLENTVSGAEEFADALWW